MTLFIIDLPAEPNANSNSADARQMAGVLEALAVSPATGAEGEAS
jgi:hypothetical protein